MDRRVDGVLFSTKELFLQIRQDLQALSNRIDVDIRTLSGHVADIDRLGTQQARDALRQAGELKDRVIDLEKDAASRTAVERNEEMIRRVIVAVSLSFVGIIVQLIMYFTKH